MLWRTDREIKREAPEVPTPQAHVIGEDLWEVMFPLLPLPRLLWGS